MREMEKIISKRLQIWGYLNLNQKIDHALGTMEKYEKEMKKEAYISFSGGRDSTVLLDLARRFYRKDILAVFCNTGNEHPEIVRFVRNTDNVRIIYPEMRLSEIIEKYGFPVISKEVSKNIWRMRHGKKCGAIPDKYKYLFFEKYEVSNICCKILKKDPFKKFQKETGMIPIVGTKAFDSQMRRFAYYKRGGCNSFSKQNPVSAPLSIWKDKDIEEYIQRYNVQICDLYTKENYKRTGCMLCGFGVNNYDRDRFEKIKEKHPRVYEQLYEIKNNGVSYYEVIEKLLKLEDYGKRK